MLAVATLLSALQYASFYSNKMAIANSISTYTSLNSLHAQVMFLNIYTTRLALNSTTAADLLAFTSDVNLLDSLTNSIPLSIQAQLSYSDGSQQQMLLAFAINKLIS